MHIVINWLLFIKLAARLTQGEAIATDESGAFLW